DRQDADPGRPGAAAGALPVRRGHGPMSHEAFADLAAGYALDALEPEERRQFEAHVATGCAEGQTALTEHAETLAALAAELPRVPAPPAVRTRLLRRVEASVPAARPARARSGWRWPALAVASLAAAVLLVYLGIQVRELRRELAVLAQDAAALR